MHRRSPPCCGEQEATAYGAVVVLAVVDDPTPSWLLLVFDAPVVV